MKNLFLILFLCMLQVALFAQSKPTFTRADAFGGRGNDICHKLSIDTFGNVYASGWFSDTVDFDKGPGVYALTAHKGTDIFICKTDAGGNLLWARSIRGNSNDFAYSLTTDNDGNVYTVCTFDDTADFDPGAGVHNLIAERTDIAILKLDKNGNFVWVKQMKASKAVIGFTIGLDKKGNIYTGGEFYDSADFDPGAGVAMLRLSPMAGGADMFVCKLNPNGNFVWAKSFGGKLYNRVSALVLDEKSNVFFTGWYSDNTDFDPGPSVLALSSRGGDDIFVSKLDSNGNLVWVRGVGALSTDWSNAIALDADGNVYTTGQFTYMVDFNPESGVNNLTATAWDMFLWKLNPEGKFVWAKKVGGNGGENGNGICINKEGIIHLSGSYSGSFHLSLKTGSHLFIHRGGFDILFLQADTSGNFLFAYDMGGTDQDQPSDIRVDKKGNIYSSGLFVGNADLDPGPDAANFNSAGLYDFFIHAMKQCPFIDTGITEGDVALMADQEGAQYQWVDCDNNFAPLPGKTERFFIPDSNGNYAVIVSLYDCSDTSRCITINHSHINRPGLEKEFEVYPNPGSGIFHLKFPGEADRYSIELYNALGTLFLRMHSENPFMSLDLSPYADGIYFIRWVSEEAVLTRMLVKE